MSEINQLIREQKKYGEETEFYPTTEEIVKAFLEDIDSLESTVSSILDIGCGNGAFFEKINKLASFHESYGSNGYCHNLHKDFDKYGIEKSFTLINALPDNVVLLGCDFHSTNLIDKKVDIIFCNPPFSEFEEWTDKIIRTGNCRDIYLVLPERWKNSNQIKAALSFRDCQATTIGSFDFLEAERKARGTTELIHVFPPVKSYGKFSSREKMKDPFDLWFDNEFKINAEKKEEYTFMSDRKEKIENEIVGSEDISRMLVELYDKDMNNLYANYKSLEKLDSALFKELKINVENLKESLKVKLQNLKSLYWNILFDRYGKITDRITSKERQRILRKLKDNVTIDFTLDNIYQVTLWIIRNSNKIFDSQLTDFFYSLCDEETIHRYKSNKRWHDDDWKYIKEHIRKNTWRSWKDEEYIKTLKNISLDYRIISSGYSNFHEHYNGKTSLSENARDFISDMYIIAENLGFKILKDFNFENYAVDTWHNCDILMPETNEIFCNIKLYKNGNRHIKFNKKFMQKLNVEMARINGWINNKKEAQMEFDFSDEEINEAWKIPNFRISISDCDFLKLPEAS